ncbi:hypothetical protein JTE90_019601 [Oedothorax gibbosus]|uniref:Dehydrogenase/reductase SDR family member 11 n=1 Tax=Oedothorax gibbosus TaxID=931172 RepID=A0AAV6V5Y0_9ARAC|nr:hypothetical protein JTE90_019601 [Oedothorax gibbosus]
MDRWEGRVALVTGASAGIGAQMCRTLATHGMQVVGCAREVDRIPKTDDGSIIAIKCDLTSEEDINSLFSDIRERFGRLDLCINNAGLSHDVSLLSTQENATQKWKNMVDVNVLALCICTREAVKLMKENNIDDGQIIHISSMSGHRIPEQTSYMYVATKCMVKSLTEGHRRELRADGSKIKVASISPGLVETEFEYRCFPDDPNTARSIYESYQCLRTEDIANAVLYVLRAPPNVDIHDVLLRPTGQNP